LAQIGQFNQLTVIKMVDHGLYVDGGDLGEILLPKREVPDPCALGDQLKVFIYTDSEDRFMATTTEPLAFVGEIACLTVLQTTAVGAFLDWGLPKDLLVPFSEQKTPLVEGQVCVVYVFLDDRTERIVASTKLSRHVMFETLDVERGQAVELLICDQSPLGYSALIDSKGLGLIHNGDVFTEIEIGQTLPGYIKKVREDGQIDLSIQAPGYEKIKGIAGDILEALEKAGGQLNVSDKSPPEIIYANFGISKKAFKKAIGRLYKERLIVIEKGSIKIES
jgi:uncharacterized protein